MLDSPLPVAARPTPPPAREPVVYARCVVLADGIETWYRRAGRGTAVLVLGPVRGLGAVLLDTLPTEFRVLIPVLPPTSSSFCDWLRGFLDGLGLSTVSIVAEQELGLAAVGFAVIEPDRVERLVLLAGRAPDRATAPGGIPVDLVSASHPLLTLHSDDTEGRHIAPQVEQVVAFLGGAPPA